VVSRALIRFHIIIVRFFLPDHHFRDVSTTRCTLTSLFLVSVRSVDRASHIVPDTSTPYSRALLCYRYVQHHGGLRLGHRTVRKLGSSGRSVCSQHPDQKDATGVRDQKRKQQQRGDITARLTFVQSSSTDDKLPTTAHRENIETTAEE